MGKGKKVIVAMSGGVDSSVAAALLKKRGYDVCGVFMRLWRETRKLTKQNTKLNEMDGGEKCVRAVAKKLNIPLTIIDLKQKFKKKVVDYFLKEFAGFRTPNPCVVCNQKIKFGLLLDKAKEMGADYVATGHYVKKSKIKNQKSKLLIAKDKTKDQSYFLYTLTQEKLKHLLFPIGEYKKSEVYKMAEKWQLPFQKKESVDICFLTGQDHREFLKKYLKMKPGKIIDANNRVLGGHRGLPLYTIGQRAEIGGPGPYYVVEINVKNNALIVTNNPRDLMLFSKSLITDNVNWISGKEPELSLKCKARIRYGHAAAPATISKQLTVNSKQKKAYSVKFKTAQRAITPGQSVVFYKRNEVLGGGIIRL